MTDRLKELADAGVSIWLDDLSRQRLTSGNLESLIHDQHISGVTTNPTIFAKAISDANAYAEQVHRLAAEGVSTDEAIRAITTDDVRDAADLFKPVYDDSEGVDGRVSIEVEPGFARDTEKTIRQAKELWEIVGRENVFIKIPATKEGIPAITATLAEGISVNVTLIFSLQRYAEVIDAFFDGMERAQKAGHDLPSIGSVASFFVSRVDSEVDKRLDKIGTDEAKALRGKAAVANARLAYELFEQKFSSERWKALEQAGARLQRPLWASTSTKDPAYDDTMYVVDLVAPNTVNTMPESTIEATYDHGVIPNDSIRGYYDDARDVMKRLADLGIEYDDVVRVLEEEGVEKFEASWVELIDAIAEQLKDKAKG
jgi:transaldolase